MAAPAVDSAAISYPWLQTARIHQTPVPTLGGFSSSDRRRRHLGGMSQQAAPGTMTACELLPVGGGEWEQERLPKPPVSLPLDPRLFEESPAEVQRREEDTRILRNLRVLVDRWLLSAPVEDTHEAENGEVSD